MHCRLAQYLDAFMELGWDDVLYILSLQPDTLTDICEACQMRPGHVMRFLDYAQEFKEMHNISSNYEDTFAMPAAPTTSDDAPASAAPSASPVLPASEPASVEVALPCIPSAVHPIASSTAGLRTDSCAAASLAEFVDDSSIAAPDWWRAGHHDRLMAEVFFLSDSKCLPAPQYYNDRLVFGGLATHERFPDIEPQRLLQAATYIDSQLVPGGRIRAHWQKLKAKEASIASIPRAKRTPDLASNSKVWVDRVSKKPFYTDENGQLL